MNTTQSPTPHPIGTLPPESALWVQYLEVAQILNDKSRLKTAIDAIDAWLPAAPLSLLLRLARAAYRMEDQSFFIKVLSELFAQNTLSLAAGIQIMQWSCEALDTDRSASIIQRLSKSMSASDRDVFLVQATRMVHGPEESFALARRLFRHCKTPQEAEYLAKAAVESARAALAGRFLRFCVRKWPNAIPLKHSLFRALAEAGETKQARHFLDAASDTLAHDDLLKERLNLAMQEGDHAEVAQLHNRLLVESSTYARTHLSLRVAVFQGDLEQVHKIWRSVPQGTMSHKRVTFFGSIINELELFEKTRGPESANSNYEGSFLHPALDVVRPWPLGQPNAKTIARAKDPVAEIDRADTITRQIVQYWDTPTIPDGLQEVMASWKNIPGWSYHHFNRVNAKTWLRENFGRDHVRAFLMSRHAAEQSDFFRLCFLDAVGGLYVDADDKRTGSPEALLAGRTGAVLFREDIGTICNNVMYAQPRHPLISLAREMALRALLRRDNDNVWSKTGPGLMTRATARFIKAKGPEAADGLTLLPFYAMKQHIRPHMRIPYKLTAAYWNKENAGRSTVLQDTWSKLAEESSG